MPEPERERSAPPEREVPPEGGVLSESRTPSDGGLIPVGEREKLSHQLHRAVDGFVDAPRDAVEEAEHVLEEISARLRDGLDARRRSLRTAWREASTGDAESRATVTDTERLRLALRDYRDTSERLLRLL